MSTIRSVLMEREPGKRADAPVSLRHKPVVGARCQTLLGLKQRVLTGYRGTDTYAFSAPYAGHYVGNDQSQCRPQKVKMMLNSARVRTLLKTFLKSSF